MAELLREQEVKIALIEWLYKKGMLSAERAPHNFPKA